MKTILSRATWIPALIFLLCGVTAEAATVRGRVTYRSPHGQAPAAGVTVTINHPRLGRSAPSQTKPDGMYYLTVPPGQYTLEIWTGSSQAPARTLTVNVRDPATDVPPVTL